MRRREFIAGTLATAAFPLVARGQPAPADRVKGPPVWLDMDQKALDDAYDQRVYAPNMQQVIARCEHVGDLVRRRIGEPKRLAYGTAPIEGLDLYAAKAPNAPVNVYVHGGAWRTGTAKESAHHVEMLVGAGAHAAVLDFNNVLETGGNLMTMADQVILMRQGRIEQDGPPDELYARPASAFAARFVGTPPMNLLALSGPPAGMLLGVRPEHVRLDEPQGREAEVSTSEYLGADTIVTCLLGAQQTWNRQPCCEKSNVDGAKVVTTKVRWLPRCEFCFLYPISALINAL